MHRQLFTPPEHQIHLQFFASQCLLLEQSRIFVTAYKLMGIIPRMDYSKKFPTLWQKWSRSVMADQIGAIDLAAISSEFHGLRQDAPRRSRPYFVGHNGIPSSFKPSNRREEHIAIALYNLDRMWHLGQVGNFRIIDYQVPLKSRQSDCGIGKIDLMGITDDHILVIELKVTAQKGGRGDPPITALLEGLRYAAIVDANMARLSSELQNRSYMTVPRTSSPSVLVVGEQSWWEEWRADPDANAAFQYLHDLTVDISRDLNLDIYYAELSNVTLQRYGGNGMPPILSGEPAFRLIDLK